MRTTAMVRVPAEPCLIALLLSMVGALALADPLAAQSVPPTVHSRAAAFDVQRGRLVVFGGYYQGRHFDDTWEFDGSSWEQRLAPGSPIPAARNSAALTFDEARGVTLLFGGNDADALFGDTWVWNGERWREILGSGPAPRFLQALAYDRARGRVVLFGGVTSDSAGVRRIAPEETWEWDGARWHLASTSGPRGRALYGLAYDSRRQRTVLYGGMVPGPDGRPAETLADTWEWDGIAWTHIESSGPGPRDHVSMTYDETRGVIVLHGGAHGGGAGDALNDTWEYNGDRWRIVTTAGPARAAHRMIFDARAGRVMLYGGWSRDGASGELWQYDQQGWSRVQ